MKKIFAIIISALVLLTCFTSCKAKVKDKDLIKDNGDKGYAAVTNENGGIIRDEAGNLIVNVTDSDGHIVKENGEVVTNPVAIEHALVVGNRIECPHFAMTIPNGWSDNTSYSDLSIQKDGTKDFITVMCIENSDIASEMVSRNTIINKIDESVSEKEITNRDVTIGDIQAHINGIYAKDASINFEAYTAFIFFEVDRFVYVVALNSDHNMGYEEAVSILSTMEFYN